MRIRLFQELLVLSDEKRNEAEHAEKKQRASNRHRKKTEKRPLKLANPSQRSTADSQPDAAPTHEEGNHR
jgi:hypothetical protein